jgi:hypothetical protein
MKFIRILWGDFNKYANQIMEARQDKLDETVFVWGKDNYLRLMSLGYDCILISDDPYDYQIANNHTFIDHKSLIHKIKGIEIALTHFNEVVFVDWDVRKTKEIDDNFYQLLRSKNASLQVPLYTYPVKAFEFLINTIKDPVMRNFFDKLERFVVRYSYRYNKNYIIPNTGFMYCNSIDVIRDLLLIIKNYQLETVPDELSVFINYEDYDLESYIKLVEPLVINGKEHGHDWWDEEEETFNLYKSTLIKKDIYFEHF